MKLLILTLAGSWQSDFVAVNDRVNLHIKTFKLIEDFLTYKNEVGFWTVVSQFRDPLGEDIFERCSTVNGVTNQKNIRLQFNVKRDKRHLPS